MDCDLCRAAISAQLDGEDPGVAPAALESHLAGCAGCRDFAAGSAELHRTTRITPAEPVPDLTPAILRAIDAEAAPRAVQAAARTAADERTLFLRICLAVVAVIQLGMAVPALVLGDDAGLPTHVARHLGSFSLALGVGLLVVAWRPDRAAGVLPVIGVVVFCLLASSVVDIASGRAAAGSRGEPRPRARRARRSLAAGPQRGLSDHRQGASRAWMTA